MLTRMSETYMIGAYRGKGNLFLHQFLSRNYEVWITLYQPNISTDIRFIRILTFIDYKYVRGHNILAQFNPPTTSPEGYHELLSFNDVLTI